MERKVIASNRLVFFLLALTLTACSTTKDLKDSALWPQILEQSASRPARLELDSETAQGYRITVRQDSTSWEPARNLKAPVAPSAESRTVATSSIKQIVISAPQRTSGMLVGGIVGLILGGLAGNLGFYRTSFTSADQESIFPSGISNIGSSGASRQRTALAIGIVVGLFAGDILGGRYEITYRRDTARVLAVPNAP